MVAGDSATTASSQKAPTDPEVYRQQVLAAISAGDNQRKHKRHEVQRRLAVIKRSRGVSNMQKAGSNPPTCYFPDPDSSFDYNPRQEDQHGITDARAFAEKWNLRYEEVRNLALGRRFAHRNWTAVPQERCPLCHPELSDSISERLRQRVLAARQRIFKDRQALEVATSPFELEMRKYCSDPYQAKKYSDEQAIEYLAICDVERGIRARIQRLTTEPNPQQAMLEVLRLLRDIDWTNSDIVEFAVLNDIEMALLPEKRESRRETTLEIVYRQDWPSEEKAYHLYQLHNAVRREVAEGMKERHHVSLDEMN